MVNEMAKVFRAPSLQKFNTRAQTTIIVWVWMLVVFVYGGVVHVVVYDVRVRVVYVVGVCVVWSVREKYLIFFSV
jgi:hypothetical protein